MLENPIRAPRNWRTPVLIGVVVLALAVGGLLVVAAGRIASAIPTTKASALAAEAALREGDFVTADAELGEALAAMQRARGGLRLVAFLRIVPWVGTQLRGLDYTLAAGEETVGAMREAVAIVLEVQTVTEEAQELVGITEGSVPYGELATSARVAMLDALHDAHPQLLTMQVKLGIARDNLERLDTLNVTPQLREAVAPFRDLIVQLDDAVDVLTPFAAAVPELAGLGEDRQFLMLFANNTELRPAGGFLGVYGLAVTRDGEVVSMTTDDVYNVDNLVADDGYHVTPPTPLADYLGVPKWYFRDSNWSPDFPTAVHDGVQLFRQEVAYAGQPVPEVHGALMFTPSFIARMLDYTGSITVDEQTFTAANIADKLEYQVEQGYAEQGIPSHQRKDIVARMSDMLLDRVLDMPSGDWPELFAMFSEGFARKEIALWSADTAMQATYVDAGWAGTVDVGTADDVLMVVDANLGALKTDPVVDRTIEYRVTPTSRGYEATVNVTYENNGSFTWKTTRYRTYTRVYVPQGSVLVSTNGEESAVTTADELGLTSFGAFISIEPSQSETLTFTYLLPDAVGEAIAGGLYELQVLKQLGAADHELVLDLDFGKDVTRATPAEDATAWGDDVYHVETELMTDATFTVRL